MLAVPVGVVPRLPEAVGAPYPSGSFATDWSWNPAAEVIAVPAGPVTEAETFGLGTASPPNNDPSDRFQLMARVPLVPVGRNCSERDVITVTGAVEVSGPGPPRNVMPVIWPDPGGFPFRDIERNPVPVNSVEGSVPVSLRSRSSNIETSPGSTVPSRLPNRPARNGLDSAPSSSA